MILDDILDDRTKSYNEKLKAALEHGCPVCGCQEFDEVCEETNLYSVGLNTLKELAYSLENDLEARPINLTCVCGFVIWDKDGWWTER